MTMSLCFAIELQIPSLLVESSFGWIQMMVFLYLLIQRKYEHSTAPQVQPTLHFLMTAHSLIIWEWAVSGGGAKSMRGSR